jgi:hypothetical protein
MSAVHVLCNAAPDGIVPAHRGPQVMQMTVSRSILDEPEHWLERAEEARSIADQLSDPESRRMMLRIAEDYERLANHARRRTGRTAQS